MSERPKGIVQSAVKGRNTKTRTLSHIYQVVLLNVGGLTGEGRSAFPQRRVPQVFQKEAKNRFQALQNRAGSVKIEASGFQNRAWRPPRHHFQKTSNLRGSKRAVPEVFSGFMSQLGSHVEAQDLPKSNPKPEKTMLKNEKFSTSMLKGFGHRFRKVFGRFVDRKCMRKVIS